MFLVIARSAAERKEIGWGGVAESEGRGQESGGRGGLRGGAHDG